MTKKELKIDDKFKFSDKNNYRLDHGICTVTKIRNYKTKGKKIYIQSQWGYGFMMWLTDMDTIYEKI